MDGRTPAMDGKMEGLEDGKMIRMSSVQCLAIREAADGRRALRWVSNCRECRSG